MLKNYFRLFEECYLVDGKGGGAIYNVLTGYVYKVTDKQFNILSLLEQNQSIDIVISKLNIDTKLFYETLQDIQSSQLGDFFENKVFIDKLTKDPEWKRFIFFEPPIFLRRAFIELENKCLNNCFFCNNNQYLRRNMCLGCSKNEVTGKVLSTIEIFKVLEDLKKLECEEINFTGGDIFINWPRTKEILEKGNELGFKNINVFFGGQDIPINILKTLSSLNITLIIQKFVDNEIVLINNALINKLKKENLNLNIGFILLLKYEDNSKADYISEKLNLILQCKFVLYDFLLATYNESCVKKYMNEINEIPRISMDEFFIKRRFNSCFNASLSVTADGYIIPCLGLRNHKIGHVNNLKNVFIDKQINKYWELSKDKIQGCKTCEFRYACNDCRYIESKFGSSLMEMSSCSLCKMEE